MIDQPALTTLTYIVCPLVWLYCLHLLHQDLTNETHLDERPEWWTDLDEEVWSS